MEEITLVLPRERIPVLIGTNGSTKSEIEESFGVDLDIDSGEGVVRISAREGMGDPINLLRARDVVVAIGRGFSPDKALLLRDEDMMLDVIDLREVLGKNENQIRRVKGRVIGEEGKMRRAIEEATGARLSIYGHTIAIIGDYESASFAREAVEMLINGKQHSTVYKFLSARRRAMKRMGPGAAPGG